MTANRLVDEIQSCVRRHLQHLEAQGATVFGYALLTSEDISLASPVGVANVRPFSEEWGADFFYAPDEWDDWGNEFFRDLESSVEALSNTASPEDSPLQEAATLARLYGTFTTALGGLREDKVFGEHVFLALWISDPDDWSISEEAIAALNSQEELAVYEQRVREEISRS